MSEEKTKIEELEREIAGLKEYIFRLDPKSLAPSNKLQKIRKECREKYFGSFYDIRDGNTLYGPKGKSYSDYSLIEEIITKTSGLIFKYSYGKSASSVVITNLVKTDEDVNRYKNICESVCKELREKIDSSVQNGQLKPQSTNKAELCVESIKHGWCDGHTEIDILSRLHYARGYLSDVTELRELLDAIIGDKNSPVPDQSNGAKENKSLLS